MAVMVRNQTDEDLEEVNLHVNLPCSVYVFVVVGLLALVSRKCMSGGTRMLRIRDQSILQLTKFTE